MNRNSIIERAAALLFGRDPETGGPEKGWKAKLARALGVGNSAITETLGKDESPVFDRKLYTALSHRRHELGKDMAELTEMMTLLSPEHEQQRHIISHAHDPQKILAAQGWIIISELRENGIFSEMTCIQMEGRSAICTPEGYVVDGERLTLSELVGRYRPQDLPQAETVGAVL